MIKICFQRLWKKQSVVKRKTGEEWDKDYPSPELVRKEYRPKQTPLLIIYPLNPVCSNVKGAQIEYKAEDEPFIGLAISFPGSNTDHAVSYVVNQVGDFAETEEMFDENNDNIYE